MKGLLRFLLVIPFAVLAAGLLLVWMLVDASPLVSESRVLSADDAVRARQLLQDARSRLAGGADFTISASEDELNSLLAIGHRALAGLNGEVRVHDDQVLLLLSLRLPDNPVGSYLNSLVDVRSDPERLALRTVRIGRVPVPGTFALFFLRTSLGLLLGAEEGELLDMVRLVGVENDRVLVAIEGVGDLDGRLAAMKEHIRSVRDTVMPGADVNRVREYYRALTHLDQIYAGADQVSLAHFLQPLFQMAADADGRAAQENQAVILALAVFLGHERLEELVGRIRIDDLAGYQRQTGNVLLGGRQDLRQHFLVSAALQVLSQKGISHAIGEFKELLDSSSGGSGFSFKDLAADRAGVRFAEEALAGGDAARRLQVVLSGKTAEMLFFPELDGLPEGLSADRFKAVFTTVESAAYQRLVRAIDDCISRLPAYEGTVGKQDGPCRLAAGIPDSLVGK